MKSSYCKNALHNDYTLDYFIIYVNAYSVIIIMQLPFCSVQYLARAPWPKLLIMTLEAHKKNLVLLSAQ